MSTSGTYPVREVRFHDHNAGDGDGDDDDDKVREPSRAAAMNRPHLHKIDSDSSAESADDDQVSAVSYHDSTSHTTPFSSFDGRTPFVSGLAPSAHYNVNAAQLPAPGNLRRLVTTVGDVTCAQTRMAEAPLTSASVRPQRPTAPARTPSSTYAPARRPQPSHSISTAFEGRLRSLSNSRRSNVHDPNRAYRAQEKAYVQRLRQDQPLEYFEPYTPSVLDDDYDSDLDRMENESPASEAYADVDVYNSETLLFYGNDTLEPTEEDIRDPANRERLEWHGMLASVLTGDVVKQEKKRQFAYTEKSTDEALRQDLWYGIRSRIVDLSPATQKRIIEQGRSAVDATLDEIAKFTVAGESEAGKTAIEQVTTAIARIDACESLYPSHKDLLRLTKAADQPLYKATYDALVSWQNTQQMINREIGILQKWVGNDELDFLKAKPRSPTGHGLSDESSFLDRLLKEDGLTSLNDTSKSNMLSGIGQVVTKAKETLIQNSEAFAKRHLPPYIEELLTLISFPSRLIEDIIKVRLTYARQMKENARQNVIMQDQMINQFQILLNLAIKIKHEYELISAPQPGWDLPPCIDESFDQVVLDALRYYFKMTGWRLSANKNAFKEAEILEQEWHFSNEIGQHLQGGDVEVAEQFSSLTHKAVFRLNQSFEKELQKRPNEAASDLEKRYKSMLDSVRVRQRMLQRFSRLLSDKFENATDFSILMNRSALEELYELLITSGHFLVYTASVEHEGIFILASANLWDQPEAIQALLGMYTHPEHEIENPLNPYLLILRPENPIQWTGRQMSDANIREPAVDVKIGHLRLIADASGPRLVNARIAFLESLGGMHLDMVVEQRSNLHKVNTKLTEIKKVAYKLSNMIMDSVEVIRRQTKGMDLQELVQSCFVFATDFGQRSLIWMDRNRKQMNNIKLTKLALDWVTFICDDCSASEKKTFRWAVAALEFAMMMTTGSSILALGEDEYAKFRLKVGGCMSLLISHFDIMGARSTLAAQAEKLRIEASSGTHRKFDSNQAVNEEQRVQAKVENRLAQIDELEDVRRAREAERQALGRILEEANDADRSLTYLSSSATNVTMRWQQGNFVGGGTFGSVYSAINLDSGYLMAVKEIRLQDPQLIPTIAAQIRDEMSVLEVLDHPNVVSYHGIEVHRDKVYIFMEFCSGGALSSLLEHGRIEDEQIILVYSYQLVEGLAYLHNSGIIHRDIKPENILLDHAGVIKYVDFGAAKVIARQGKTLVATQVGPGKPAGQRSMTGTPMYMSPEVINPSENSGRAGACDVWSLGCVILEMATGRRPWASLDNEYAIMWNIAQGNPPQLPTTDQMSPEGIDFLEKCFIRDPRKRASAAELLQHEWILQISGQVSKPTTPSDSGSSSAGSSRF